MLIGDDKKNPLVLTRGVGILLIPTGLQAVIPTNHAAEPTILLAAWPVYTGPTGVADVKLAVLFFLKFSRVNRSMPIPFSSCGKSP